MQSLLVVNPSKRPNKRRGAKRTAKRKHAKRKTNPINAAAVMRRSRRSAKRRHTSRRRRNPIAAFKSATSGIMSAATDGVIGGLGALGANTLANMVPLPASLNSPTVKKLVTLGIGVGLGLVAEKTMGKDKGRAVMAGTVAVVSYELLGSLLGSVIPGMQLNGLGASDIVLPYEEPYYLPAGLNGMDGVDGLGATDADGVEVLPYSV